MADTALETAHDEPPDRAAVRAEIRAWLEANGTRAPEAGQWDVSVHRTIDDAREFFDTGRAWLQTIARGGWAGITYPTELGGRGDEPWVEKMFREESEAYWAGSRFQTSTIAMLGPTLSQHGTDEQKHRYLPGLLSGEVAWCQLFSEPGAGSDLAGLATRAVRDGDEFIVTGQKVWNSCAMFCDRAMLLARTDPDLPKHQGITFFLLDLSLPGIEIRPLVQPNGAAHFCEVFLEDVRVPASEVLGQVDGGWSPARTVLSNESAFIGSGNTTSTGQNLIDLARQFERLDDPVLRQSLVRYLSRERIIEWMSASIMTAIRRREKPPMDPGLLKLYMAENRVQSGDLAAEIQGLASMVGDTPTTEWAQIELLGRYAVSIGGGTNEVQRNNLGERALGLPREPRVDKDVPWRDVPRS